MAVPIQRPMTEAEFFAWQAKQEHLYELVDSRPQRLAKHRMMVGATRVHDGIVTRTRTIIVLGNQLKGKPCSPFTADIAIRTRIDQPRRAEVGVDCGRGAPSDRTAADPRVVMEVLSPSTRAIDLTIKLEEYRRVASIAVILLVDPESPVVLVYRRRGDVWDIETARGLEAVIELPEIDRTLALADLYEGVTFPVV